MAIFADSRGRTRTVPLTADGKDLHLEHRCWYISYRDWQGRRKVVKGYTDREATEAKARELERQAARRREGLLVIDPERLSAKFEAVLDLYVADLEGRGKDSMHVYITRKRLEKLAAECNWPTPASIRLEDLTAWRGRAAKDGKSGKTLNQYVSHLQAFVSFMIAQGYLAENPVANIDKADESGKKRPRRGLAVEQLRRLLSVSGDRAIVYLTAMKTGLRRDELGKLEVGDVMLLGPKPHIKLRGTANKARREDVLPLDEELVEQLGAHIPAAAQGSDRVFVVVPPIDVFKADLAAAAIPYKDTQGRQADFHSLRLSYNMLLAAADVPVRVAMSLMRHTDIKLTTGPYNDPTLLDLQAEVDRLPRLTPAKPKPPPADESQAAS